MNCHGCALIVVAVVGLHLTYRARMTEKMDAMARAEYAARLASQNRYERMSEEMDAALLACREGCAKERRYHAISAMRGEPTIGIEEF